MVIFRKTILFFFALTMLKQYLSAQCNQGFDLGNDTVLCVNDQLALNINDIYDTYLWHDNISLNSNIINGPGNYYCTTTQINNTNFVNNGDFELGNFQFNTDYTYYPIADVFGPQASYGIINNANTWFNPFNACNDHTSGNGLMMVIDGSSFNGGTDAIWCQSINVQAGSKYQFSYWIQSVTPSNILANIEVKIDGVTLGANLAPSGPCVWQQREYIWTSTVSGAVDFCLYDLELAGNGNDFALDDISLFEICEYSDTILVSAAPNDTIQVLEEICPSDSLFIGGAWQFDAGTFYDVATISNCIEVTETTLGILTVDTIFETQEICENDSIFIDGEWQNQIGIYFEEIPGTTCPNVKQTSLIVNALPLADAGDDITIALEQTLTIEALGDTSSLTFLWTSMDSIYSEASSFEFEVSEYIQTFYLEVTEGICTNTDSIAVFGLPVILSIQVPDAFSPNLDGVNDFFGVVNRSEFQEIQMKIYNRWGELVFNDENGNTSWNGQYKQENCPTDVYIYFIETLPYNTLKKMTKSGTLTLIR